MLLHLGAMVLRAGRTVQLLRMLFLRRYGSYRHCLGKGGTFPNIWLIACDLPWVGVHGRYHRRLEAGLVRTRSVGQPHQCLRDAGGPPGGSQGNGPQIVANRRWRTGR